MGLSFLWSEIQPNIQTPPPQRACDSWKKVVRQIFLANKFKNGVKNSGLVKKSVAYKGIPLIRL